MAITIKNADYTHISGIADVFHSAFNEDIAPASIQRGLNSPHHSLVALDRKRVIGFTAGFITTAQNGQKRLELDLQAVHEDYQKQGIGTLLIKQFCKTTAQFDLIRALVAVDNHPMHHTMTKTGFVSERQSQSLYIAIHNAEAQLKLSNAHLVPVTTLSYSGIWLEGTITPQAIYAAYAALSQRKDDDVIGAVVSRTDTATIKTLMNEDFNYIKEFYWWTKTR